MARGNKAIMAQEETLCDLKAHDGTNGQGHNHHHRGGGWQRGLYASQVSVSSPAHASLWQGYGLILSGMGEVATMHNVTLFSW